MATATLLRRAYVFILRVRGYGQLRYPLPVITTKGTRDVSFSSCFVVF